MGQTFVVKTEQFTGPLDLLLQLIEKRKLFIGDISLATVADDFLAYIKEHASFPVATVAHFLVVASTLLLIKSKALLPYLKLTEEESQDIADLEYRLKLYKQIRDVGVHIQKLFGERILFTRSKHAPIEATFAPHEKITIENLRAAAEHLVSTLPPVEDLKHVAVEKVISLEEMIDTLTVRIKESIETSFSRISEGSGHTDKEKKLNTIVSFLALLELVKEGIVLARQQTTFEDIAIAKT